MSDKFRIFNLVLLSFSFYISGCTSSTSIKAYSGDDLPLSEISIIWNPETFINKIDKKYFGNIFGEHNTIKELFYIQPGNKKIEVKFISDIQQSGLTTISTTLTYKLSAEFKKGHAYYLYRESLGQEYAFFLRDLGQINETFNPPILPKERTVLHDDIAAFRKENREIYEATKEMGVAVQIFDELKNQ